MDAIPNVKRLRKKTCTLNATKDKTNLAPKYVKDKDKYLPLNIFQIHFIKKALF